MSIEAMKQALDNVCNVKLYEINRMNISAERIHRMDKQIHALRQAIEFQEMVAKGTKAWANTPDDWVDDLRGGVEQPWVKTYAGGKPNYTTRQENRQVAKNTTIGNQEVAKSATTDNQTPECKTDPRAPHGFDRNASHSADRYVCECESWEPNNAA